MSPLVGREREVEAVTSLIDSARDRGGTLTIRGEAGIGKTALLREARRHAEEQGALVLSTTGIEAEASLPFAGLHQLLRPVLAGVDGLPPPQRDALRVAFGTSAGSPPDRFLLGLATLTLLAEAAERQPVLVLVDDAQWVDRSTSEVLAFVERRVEADPIVVLSAVRDEDRRALVEAAPDVLRLAPLSSDDAAACLDRLAPGLPSAVRDRVLREAAGNPLALTELPAALDGAGRGRGLPSRLPLTTRLERAFAARLAALPDVTRTALLTAAADERGVVREVLAATGALAGRPVSLDALAPAVDLGLVEVADAAVRFVHPLVRSAVYQAAGLRERRAAHAALADAIDEDSDRSVWHRAASADGPTVDVATALEEAARRAQRRGAAAVAAEAVERAARLHPASPESGRLLLEAALLRYDLGQHEETSRLLREAERHDLRPDDEAWLQWYREGFEDASWSGADRAQRFVEIADRLREAGAPDRALAALQAVALRCFWANADPETCALFVEAAERIPALPTTPRLLNVLALVGTETRGALVLDRLARVTPGAERDPEASLMLGDAAAAVGDVERATRFLEVAVDGLRAEGRLGLLSTALVSQAWTAVHVGNWDLGRRAAAEAARLAPEVGQPLYAIVADLAAATLAAYRGEADAADVLAARGEAVLLPIGANPMLALVELPRGVAALADGRPGDAVAHLRRVFDPADPAFHPASRPWALVDLVEAAVRAGRPADVEAVVADLEALAERTRSPLLLAGLRVARPLLAPDDQAEALYLAGFGALKAWPFQRARLRLAYGEWLRRHRRAADSRAPLRDARDTFDALGAGPWGDRARLELRAAGEASRTRAPEAADVLTPQELQIAQMAAEGRTNKEIGQQLYLSHRTVGSHLYRIFPKLGITARSQLRDALGGRGDRTA